MFEYGAIGVLAVGEQVKLAGLTLGVRRKVGTQRRQSGAGLDGETLRAAILAIVLTLLVGGLLAGFGGGGAVQEIDGNHAYNFRLGRQGQGERELQEALSANEIGMELGAERIAAPAHAVDFGAAARKQGVVDRQADGVRVRDQRRGMVQDAAEQGVGVNAIALEEAIGGRPILELLTTSG